MPDRSIYDQVKLAKMMVHYAEATEENGLIVALDQEKAYDKISHDYLWRTMEKYNLPRSFTNTVRSLYESAETVIIINGVISAPFQVSRGVRQGDPLSCLLFNIAIEPLANLLRKNESLTGFTIPGASEKLTTTLFADDTTVFLNQSDDFDTLTGILSLWCKAAGAKFNEGKTEVIPIGTQTFRNQVIQTRKTDQLNTPLDPGIHIAQDGEPTRILGGWIGNNIDEQAVWSKNLDKISNTFERWGLRHPTTLGKRLIVQMFAGGISQYMATVQGMPKEIEEAIQKLINHFIWDDNRASINLNHMREHTSRGGIKLLDIKARNEAIELMWLKKYLDLSPSRPMWAIIADILMENSIARSKSIDKTVTINTFLQTWSPALSASSKLPPDLKRMLRVGRSYQVSLSNLNTPGHIKTQMPAWYHLGSTRDPRGFSQSTAAKCLKNKHLTRTVGDLVKITKRLRHVNPQDIHQDLPDCPCSRCTHDRQDGCHDPNKCCRAAQEAISRLHPKWRPFATSLNRDNLTHTPGRKKANEDARINKSEITFNPSVKLEGDINAYFRVFVDPEATCHDPALRPLQPANIQRQITTVYIEGKHRVVNDDQERVGGGIWYGPNHPRNLSLRIEASTNTKIAGVLTATLWTIRDEPPFNDLLIKTSSKTLIDGLLKNMPRWEATGFIGIEHKNLYRAIVASLRSRGAPTSFQLVPQKKNDNGTLQALKLADQGTQKDQLDEPDLQIDPRFNLTGAQLSALTQRLAYQGICGTKASKWRRGMAQMLDITRYATLAAFDTIPSDAAIWNTTKNKTFSKQFRTFLWKAIHKTQKIGEYWLNITNYEHRSQCGKCGETENLEHILLQCEIPGRAKIWETTKSLWLKKHSKWPELNNIGNITGCGLADFRDERKKPIPGANRLYQILISETAHFIWKLRNERIFKLNSEEEWPGEHEVHNRWLAIINARLTLDRSATHRKFDTRAIKSSTVLDTWTKTLKNEQLLPKNWITSPGVLVDVAQSEQNGGLAAQTDPP